MTTERTFTVAEFVQQAISTLGIDARIAERDIERFNQPSNARSMIQLVNARERKALYEREIEGLSCLASSEWEELEQYLSWRAWKLASLVLIELDILQEWGVDEWAKRKAEANAARRMRSIYESSKEVWQS